MQRVKPFPPSLLEHEARGVFHPFVERDRPVTNHVFHPELVRQAVQHIPARRVVETEILPLRHHRHRVIALVRGPRPPRVEIVPVNIHQQKLHEIIQRPRQREAAQSLHVRDINLVQQIVQGTFQHQVIPELHRRGLHEVGRPVDRVTTTLQAGIIAHPKIERLAHGHAQRHLVRPHQRFFQRGVVIRNTRHERLFLIDLPINFDHILSRLK